MNILLDTHAAVWWFAERPELPDRWRRVLAEEIERGRRVGIAAITQWEIALLAQRGRLALFEPVEQLLDRLETHRALAVLPIAADIALDSVRLPNSFPRDPADRLIAATARCRGCKLLTADDAIRSSGLVVLAA